jgi:hypothetical protein
VPFGSFVAGLSLTGGRDLGAVNSGLLCDVHNQGSFSPVLGLLACILVLSACLLYPVFSMVPSLSLHCHVPPIVFKCSVYSFSLLSDFVLGGEDGVAGQPQDSSQQFHSSLELQLVSSSRLFCLSPSPSESLPESRYKNPQQTQAQTGWTHATMGSVRPHRRAVLSLI